MPKPKKKQSFISKHEDAQTFVVKSRSQKDPLQADSDAPNFVLDPVGARVEEQAKYGIEYDDDYDYLQHLKDRSELCESEVAEVFVVDSKTKSAGPKPAVQFNLPSEVFASKDENEVGLLNMAAPNSDPKLDWDADIIAALDDDYVFPEGEEDMLDDDFMAKANSEMPIHEEDEAAVEELDEEEAKKNSFLVGKWMETISQPSDMYRQSKDTGSDFDFNIEDDDFDFNIEDDDFIGSDDNLMGSDDEWPPQMSKFSMTSAVIPRNKNLQKVDEEFESCMDREFRDEMIGDLGLEDIRGHLKDDNEIMNQCLAKDQARKAQEQVPMKDFVVSRYGRFYQEDKDEVEEVEMEEEPEKKKWDCQSILSTYSTTANHPQAIIVTRKKKTSSRVSASTSKEDSDSDSESEEEDKCPKANTVRAKGETAEERKARKQEVKKERKYRREQKKWRSMQFRASEIKVKQQPTAMKAQIM